MTRLAAAHVAVFGMGGVGSYVAEALARSGVGYLTLIDPDSVSISNLNRQLPALHSTIGQNKAAVMAARCLDINPLLSVEARPLFFSSETVTDFDFTPYTFVVDAIDTVSAKILLALSCRQNAVPLVAAMGAGNKLDPSRFEIADLSQTAICPLARVMRRELRRLGITHMRVLYSKEDPIPYHKQEINAASARTVAESSGTQARGKRQVPGSVAYVPAVAGLLIAAEVVKIISADDSSSAHATIPY